MKIIILLSILVYFIYRLSQFLIPFFLFNERKTDEAKKSEFNRKVRSMDIQDAEYEDK